MNVDTHIDVGEAAHVLHLGDVLQVHGVPHHYHGPIVCQLYGGQVVLQQCLGCHDL